MVKLMARDGPLIRTILVIVAALLALVCVPAQGKRSSTNSKFSPVTVYDPTRDAASDIDKALREAQRTQKNVLIEVGGDWCSWCHQLDDFFKASPELTKLRDQNFVTVKVNFSEENRNERVLSRYPEIPGYPHLFFLDAKGTLLQSQDTSALENGTSYSLERMTNVLKNWGPKPQGSTVAR